MPEKSVILARALGIKTGAEGHQCFESEGSFCARLSKGKGVGEQRRQAACSGVFPKKQALLKEGTDFRGGGP